MNKIELKPEIFIEGFDKEWEYRQRLYGNKGISNSIELLYQGRTNKIHEELASQCCKYQNSYEGKPFYKEYGGITWATYPHEKAKESIQSACQNEFCIIYKTTQK